FFFFIFLFFFSSRRRHTRFDCDWSSDVCSSDLILVPLVTLTSFRATPVAPLTRSASQHGLFTLPASLAVWAFLAWALIAMAGLRSEERRVGKEWRSRRGRGEGRKEGMGLSGCVG